MRTLLLSLPLLLAGTVTDAATIGSSFDSDLDGWTAIGAAAAAGSFEWRSNDGNPPGYLFLDNSEGALAYIFAPAKFRGDLTGYVGGVISFDGKLLGTGGSFYNNTNFDYGSIRITGASQTATLDLAPAGETPPQDSWKTYSASLTAAAWGKTDQQWSAILADVTEIRIGVEALFGSEAHGIDNVTLTAVPLPAGVWLLGTGVLLLAGQRARRR